MPHVESRGSDLLDDIIETLKINAYHVWEQSEQTEKDVRIRNILLEQAELFVKIAPEMNALDQSLNQIDDASAMVVAQPV